MTHLWLEAFRGIPRYARTNFATGDLAVSLASRDALRGQRWRHEGGQVLITVGELRAIAERINDLSEALVIGQGAGPVLGDAELEAYEKAQMEAAERAAAKSGLLFNDGDSERCALYNAAGDLVCDYGPEKMGEMLCRYGWVVNIFDVRPGSLRAEVPERVADAMRLVEAP